jgi:hypothetical protein
MTRVQAASAGTTILCGEHAYVVLGGETFSSPQMLGQNLAI